ncbi:hypothetical protein TWF481_007359 [Arthrobotrys musiformis]|uniref:Carrier domain-containing protein n=1 Tax=Arthrobotrys musiformis TaxID=47236 RepID=A0AAV9WCV1_9PEZI
MGIELLRYPAFAQSIKLSAKYLTSFGCPWDLEEELAKEASDSKANDPAISQPLSSALQIALVDLLEQCNVKPAIVIGHSSGEVAAAYCKGAISQRSAMKIAYFRGMGGEAASKDPNSNGTMMAVGLGEVEISPILQDLATAKGYNDIHIGCINSPKSVTIAGDAEQIGALKAILDEKGIFARQLKISCAYHSPHMIPIAREYLPLVESLEARYGNEKSDSIPMISYLTGEKVSSERLRELDYWMTNMYSAVHFTKSVDKVDQLASIAKRPKRLDLSHRNGVLITNILEVGPHSALRGPLREIMKPFQFAQDVHYESTLIRGKPAPDSFLRALGGLQCSGFHLDLSNLNGGYSNTKPSNGDDGCVRKTAQLIDLPPYPFAHSRAYWRENQRSKNHRFRRTPNELLGTPIPDFNPLHAIWRNILTPSKSEWIEDYKVGDVAVYPAAGMLAMAIEAMNQYTRETLNVAPLAFSFKDVEFIAAMPIPEPPAELETQIHLRVLGETGTQQNPEGSRKPSKPTAWFEFTISSCETGDWKTNCRGTVRAEFDTNNYENPSREPNHHSTAELPTNRFYDAIEKAGYLLGPSFKRVSQILWATPKEVRAIINVYPQGSGLDLQRKRVSRAVDRTHTVHPATLDAILQVTLANFVSETSSLASTLIPKKLKSLWLSSTGLSSPISSLSVTTQLDFSGGNGSRHSISVTDSQNNLKLEIGGYETTKAPIDEDTSVISPAQLHTCWNFNWKALAPIGSKAKPGPELAAQKSQLLRNGVKSRTIKIHVHDPSSAVTDLATALQSVLESVKETCQVINSAQGADSMASSQSDFKIILWDVDRESILAGPSKDDLLLLKKLLRSGRHILWIQTLGPLSTQFSPDHLIDGLSRVIRQEESMVSFATLSVTKTDTISRVEAISRAYQALVSENDSSNMPQTFRETSTGNIEFCQLRENAAVTKKVQSMQLGHIPTMTSWDVNTPLKMVIGSTVPTLSKTIDQEPRAETVPPVSLSEYEITPSSTFENIHFIEDSDSGDNITLQDNEVEIEVKAVGLNYNDYLVASGTLTDGNVGSEVAGVVTRIGRDTDGHGLLPGHRVCGFSIEGYRTFFRNQAQNFSVIPDSMTFAEAASIPLNFATAWHSLRYLAQLKAGETVLIHSGAGGTGQAAIQIAKYLGAANIFTTVGTDDKRELLTKCYGIPSNHIFNSQDTSLNFSKEVVRLTDGHGVDVVFSSLSGDIMLNSWECIAPFGRFVEIGKKNLQVGVTGSLPLVQLERNCSFNAVDMNYMFLKRPGRVTELVNEVIGLFKQGSLRTANQIHKFDISNITEALRLMQSGKSNGKIVVEIEPTSQVKAALTQKQIVSLTPDASYVIAGTFDDRDLGHETALWMAARGAKNLILLSQSSQRKTSASSLATSLEAMGVHCIVPSCEISNRKSLFEAIESLVGIAPPIKGCIHASDNTVLNEAPFSEITHEEWDASIISKTSGSWNLHSLLPKELDFFLLLSSVEGILGNKGQGVNAAIGTYTGALAHHRAIHGFKAVSVQLGPLASNLSPPGADTYLPVQRSDLYALLDHYCDASLPFLSPDEVQVILGLRLLHTDPQLDSGANWGRNPMFQELRRLTEADSSTPSKGKGLTGKDDASRFAAAKSDEEAIGIVAAALTRRLAATIAGMDPEDIDQNKAVQTYGVDSLQTTELRNWFLKQFRSDVPVFEILGAPSLSSLAQNVVRRSEVRSKK